MNILGAVPACSSDDDILAVVVPLQYGARSDSEPTTDAGGDGDLALRGQLRVRVCHSHILPR